VGIFQDTPTPAPKIAYINASSGDTTIISAVTGKKLRVFAITFTCSAAVTVTWKSNTTPLINTMAFDANGGMDTYRGTGGTAFVETASGEALILTLSGSSNVRGSVSYFEV
jgi:hypothetical protein